MKVICPKCQFENHAEAAHVVCARCATLIEINSAPGATASGDWPANDSGPRVTRPMSAMSAPTSPGSGQLRDPYATRIEPEPDDEVLDIPRISNGVYPIADAGAVFDDVLSTSPAPAPQNVPVLQSWDEPLPSAFQDEVNPLMTGTDDDFTSASGEVSYSESSFGRDETGFAPSAPAVIWPDFPESAASESAGSSEAKQQDWPMLPEDSWHTDADNQGPLFSTPDSGRRVWLQGLMALLVFVGLAAVAWYFLGDKLFKREQVAAKLNTRPATTETTKPGVTSGNPAAGATAAGNETAKTEAATKTEPEKGTATAPETKTSATPLPVVVEKKAEPAKNEEPAKVEPKGHSVSPGEGSLTLQVGSYKSQSEAEQRIAALRSAGINDARMVKVDLPGKGTWFRVQLERFTSREAATRRASTLRASRLISEFMVTGYQN